MGGWSSPAWKTHTDSFMQGIQNGTELCFLEEILRCDSTNPATAFLRLVFFMLKSKSWAENQGEMDFLVTVAWNRSYLGST